MLRNALEDVVISEVGDIFVLNMFNEEMGDYVMENRVVEFEPERRIVWEPVMRSIDKPELQSGVGDPAHHQWGWQLEPLDATHTRVTEFFDDLRWRPVWRISRGWSQNPDGPASPNRCSHVYRWAPRASSLSRRVLLWSSCDRGNDVIGLRILCAQRPGQLCHLQAGAGRARRVAVRVGGGSAG
jgi:hypothetical protein